MPFNKPVRLTVLVIFLLLGSLASAPWTGPAQAAPQEDVAAIKQAGGPLTVDVLTFSIDENSPNGTVVGTATYTGGDSNQTHTFSIEGGTGVGVFAINSDTGDITVVDSTALDYETNHNFDLIVRVIEGATGASDDGTITINLNDLNEAPVVNPATFSIDENSSNGTIVGSVIFLNEDAGQTHTFWIDPVSNTDGAFTIDAAGQITVADSTALDYETIPIFNLTVRVTDDSTPPLSGDGTITINLNNVNEAPVVNAATFSVYEKSPKDTRVGSVTYADQDASQSHTFSIVAGNIPNAFAINATTGVITVADSTVLVHATHPTFSLTVRVTDNDSTSPLYGENIVTVNVEAVSPIPPPAHIVISEFRAQGPSGGSDDFVELYNPTGATVNVEKWLVRTISSSGSMTTRYTFPDNTQLSSGQHYLIVGSSYSGTVTGDGTLSSGIADNGGVALTLPDGTTVVDKAGMSADAAEGAPLAQLSGNKNQSYERKPGGATACIDTDNNANDFALNDPSDPQNQVTALAVCPNAVTPTPSNTPTRTPTRTGTPTRTSTPTPTPFPSTAILNEFLPHPHTDWNQDGTANTGDEYIEIINVSTSAVSLSGWKLDDGPGGSSPYTLPDTTLEPHQIAYFFGSETGVSLSDGGDTVRLIRPDGAIADAYTYPVVGATDRTWCRLPDGTYKWGFVCSPTPGRPNEAIESGAATTVPGSKPPAEMIASCSLADTVPLAVALAECNVYGPGIWKRVMETQFWLPGRLKWDVFLE
jgi:hypothetical protein